jgi:hypothetical protein
MKRILGDDFDINLVLNFDLKHIILKGSMFEQCLFSKDKLIHGMMILNVIDPWLHHDTFKHHKWIFRLSIWKKGMLIDI